MARDEDSADASSPPARSPSAGDRDASRRYAILQSATRLAIIVTDRDGIVTEWNAGATTIFGWPAAEMIGRQVDRLFTREDIAARRAERDRHKASTEGFATEECWLVRRDGTRFHASGELTPLLAADGTHVGYVKILRDGTAAHQQRLALEEANRRLQRAQEAGGVGVFAVGVDDGIVVPTPNFCRLYGLPECRDLPAEAFERLVIPEDRDLASTAAARRDGTAVMDVEYRIRRADTGEIRWISRRGELERDATGRPLRLVGVARDITDQVVARQLLATEREQFAQLFEQASTFMAMLRGPEHRFERVNPGYVRLIGGRDVVGRTVAEALPDAVEQGFLALLDEAYRTGRPYAAHSRKYAVQPVPGGPVQDRYVDFVYQPIRDAEGAISGIFIEGADVTDRLAADKALDASEERYRTLFQAIETGFCIVEMRFDDAGQAIDYRIVEGNAAFERMTGLYGAQGRWVSEIAPGLEPHWFERYGHVARTGERIRFENPAEAFGCWYDVQAFRTGDPAAHRVAILFNDITDRKALEARQAALLELGDALRDLADPVQIAVAASGVLARAMGVSRAGYGIIDREAETITIDRDWNMPGVKSIAGTLHFREHGSYIDDLKLGRTVAIDDARHDPRTRDAVDALAGIDALSFVNMPLLEQGEFVALLFVNNATPRVWRESDLALMRDFADRVRTATERVRSDIALRDSAAELHRLNETLEQQVATRTRDLMVAEEALRQSQKMEAVGQLTGGLAHDFNNLLTGITGSLELLTMRLAQGRPADAERYVVAAQGAARRAAALTHRLLAFSRRQTLDPRPTDVNRLIAGMADLVSRTVGPEVAVEVVGASGLWATLVDPNQLENALLNLCINARDAMPGGGALTIETANRVLDARSAAAHDMEAGRYVALSVSDNGTGMTPEVIAKAFDPFFTTKPLGEGTGLGLSMIYGFARQSGGQVRIYSEIGQGTRVTLYLPRHEGDAIGGEVEAATAPPPRAAAGQTVLVVDDEPTVRMLVVEVLEELGYAALEAENGAGGLDILRSDARIDLLVTDVGLPGGMNGRQMADAARLHRPDLEILFITGYAENAVVGNGHLDPGMHVMTKPFALDALAARIRDLICSH